MRMRENPAETWGEGGHLQTKERGLRRIQLCQHLDLRLKPEELPLVLPVTYQDRV